MPEEFFITRENASLAPLARLIRFVDAAKVIAERNYYIFAHELLDFIPYLKVCVLFDVVLNDVL